jgi:hypothetical protein
MMQLNSKQQTPKALANLSPRLERSDNLGLTTLTVSLNPARVRLLANAFSVLFLFLFASPGLSLRSNPGLKLANAFGVIIQIKLHHKPSA